MAKKGCKKKEGGFTWPPPLGIVLVTPPEGHRSYGNTGSKRGALSSSLFCLYFWYLYRSGILFSFLFFFLKCLNYQKLTVF